MNVQPTMSVLPALALTVVSWRVVVGEVMVGNSSGGARVGP